MDVFERVQKFRNCHAEFKRKFGFSLSPYVHPLFGFDIVKFDERIGVPDNVSCADYIEQQYGEDAVNLIKTLIDS